MSSFPNRNEKASRVRHGPHAFLRDLLEGYGSDFGEPTSPIGFAHAQHVVGISSQKLVTTHPTPIQIESWFVPLFRGNQWCHDQTARIDCDEILSCDQQHPNSIRDERVVLEGHKSPQESVWAKNVAIPKQA